MRTSFRSIGLVAASAALVMTPLVAQPAAAAEPVSHQTPRNAKKIAKWPRMLFWGILQGVTVTAADVKAKAPAANSVGLQNVFWDGDVPSDFADAGYSTYVWYNTLTKGDGPDDGPDFGPFRSPGWNSVAGTTPPAHWIATDETTEYKRWARARGKAPEMVAHRGGGEVGEVVSRFPENSIAAFKRAVRDGAAILESDVQWTKPARGERLGVAVLMHDDSINRTVTCKPTAANCVEPVWPNPAPAQEIRVQDLTKRQLDKYQLSNGENIPTLQRLLNLADRHKVGVLPEIKNWDVPASGFRRELRDYTRLILAERHIPEVIIGSFDPTILQYFKDQGTLVKQKAPCAQLPKRLAVGKVVLLERTCVSNAGREVKVRVRTRDSAVKLTVRDNGRVVLKVREAGTVKVRFFTVDRRGFTEFDKSRTYRVKASVPGTG